MIKDQIIKSGEVVVKGIMLSVVLAAALSLVACGSDSTESKKFKRYGEGQENLETRSHRAVEEDAEGGPKREREIGSQLDADELIKIGMSGEEIEAMIRPTPRVPRLVVGLRASGPGDQISLDVTSDDGTSYSLTTEPKDGAVLSGDATPISALIVFSSIQPNAKLSFFFFGEDGRVFMMAKVQCDDVLEMVAAGNQGDRIPQRSACTAD